MKFTPIPPVDQAIQTANSWLNYLALQKAKAERMQELARLAKTDPKEAQRQMRQMDQQPHVFDGAVLEPAVRGLIDGIERQSAEIHQLKGDVAEITQERDQLRSEWRLQNACIADQHDTVAANRAELRQKDEEIKALKERALLLELEAVVNHQLTTGETSDGYHTFNELYEHRHALFLNLMGCNHAEKCIDIGSAWISKLHHDGTGFDGWFIAGIDLPTGAISYHLPERLWDAATFTGATVMDRAPEWDGHTSADVVSRLYRMVAPYQDLALEQSEPEE